MRMSLAIQYPYRIGLVMRHLQDGFRQERCYEWFCVDTLGEFFNASGWSADQGKRILIFAKS